MQPSKEQILLSTVKGIQALALSQQEAGKILDRIRRTCTQTLELVGE